MAHSDHQQLDYDVRLEWGEQGIKNLAPHTDATVIVDVLSFTTCVDIALSRNAIILPYLWQAQSDGDTLLSLEDFAHREQAIIARKRSESAQGYSLSPSSLLTIPPETRLVLPSPNGSTLTLSAAAYGSTYAGCLRNAAALADHLNQHHTSLTIIPSGERWQDGSLRPAIEDWLGAGAIIAGLSGRKSSEAQLAEAAFRHCDNLSQLIHDSASGLELINRGFVQDIAASLQLNSSRVIAAFTDNYYHNIAA